MKNPLTQLFSGSPGKRRFAWAIAVGLIVAVLTLIGGGRKIVEIYEGMTDPDRVTRMSTRLSGAGETAIPVTLLAIDDETRAKWGNPVITPHTAIASLIEIARRNGASAVLVDIDLSSDNPDQPPVPALSNEIAHAPDGGPLTMLVRSIRFRGENEGTGETHFTADSVRRTPYDRLIADTQKAVWVSALPEFSGDRVVRKIKLWQTVCDGKDGVAYASPALYVAALDSGTERRLALDRFLKARVASECGGMPDIAADWPKRHIPAVALQYVIGGGAGDAAGKNVLRGGEQVPLFLQLGAWTLLKVSDGQVEEAGSVDEAPFKGRVVVIGVTHADSRDVYATALGSQPGAMILANVVAGARALTDTPELSPLAEDLIEALLFIVFAAIGMRFHLIIATIIIGLLSAALVSALAPRLGFDSAIRVTSVAITLFVLYHLINALIAIALAWHGGLGWRAILADKKGH